MFHDVNKFGSKLPRGEGRLESHVLVISHFQRVAVHSHLLQFQPNCSDNATATRLQEDSFEHLIFLMISGIKLISHSDVHLFSSENGSTSDELTESSTSASSAT